MSAFSLINRISFTFRSRHVLLRCSNKLFFPSTSSSFSLHKNPQILVHHKNFSKTFVFSKQFQSKNGHKMSSGYTTVERGTPNSTNYAIYFKNNDDMVISPLHDIPLFANEEQKIYNMVVEIPRWTNAKMEITLKDKMNPIKQDIKKGKLRFVANCFPHKGYIWNYGALPQTWENPDHIEPSTGCKGDNDPIDVIEIGYRIAKRGEVVQVKVLGTIALIDEGETDWKIIAIDVRDPLADKIHDVGDVEKYMPGLLRATVEWFKIYKIPDGKPKNNFAFNGDAKNAEFAHGVINDVHQFWKDLICGKVESEKISCQTVTNKCSPHFSTCAETAQMLCDAPEGGEAEELLDVLDTWHYVFLE